MLAQEKNKKFKGGGVLDEMGVYTLIYLAQSLLSKIQGSAKLYR